MSDLLQETALSWYFEGSAMIDPSPDPFYIAFNGQLPKLILVFNVLMKQRRGDRKDKYINMLKKQKIYRPLVYVFMNMKMIYSRSRVLNVSVKK